MGSALFRIRAIADRAAHWVEESGSEISPYLTLPQSQRSSCAPVSTRRGLAHHHHLGRPPELGRAANRRRDRCRAWS